MFSPIPLIQRYVFGELTRAFLFVLTAVTVLTIFAGVIQQALEKGLTIEHTLLILPYVVPSMLPFTIPAALLLTVCLVYGRMAGDHEVTAAKASGISVLSLLWPALILGAVLSVFSLFLTDQVIPWAEGKIEQTIVQAMEDIILEKMRSKNGFQDPKSGLSITVAGVDGHVLLRPFIVINKLGPDSTDQITTLRAEEASIHLQPRNRKVIFQVKNAYVTLPDHQSVRYTAEKQFTFPWQEAAYKQKARYLAVSQIDDEMLSVSREKTEARDRQLVESAMALTLGQFDTLANPALSGGGRLTERTAWYLKLHTEKHSRFALACSCFFFALLGGPFAIWQGKNQFLTSFLFCFGPIVGVYYPLIMGMTAQSKQGNIDPMTGMWLGNIVLGIAALFVLRRVMRY